MSKKRARSGHDNDSAMFDVWKRELGQLSTRTFAHRLAASQDLVLRLEISRKLEKHKGCVNTVSFNAGGDILVSGSDDRRVILWDWERGCVNLSFPSGHKNNVFQAKIMPYTDDRSIVTCAADGQVRHTNIQQNGQVQTKLLAEHRGQVHKLAIEPGSAHIFYTCGEDGLVQHFDLRTGAATELFKCRSHDIRRSYLRIIHLYTIAIDPRNPNLLAVAGTDKYARLYDIRRCKWDGSTDIGQPVDYFCPPHMIDSDPLGITGLAFSDQSELLVSYVGESIYLFTRNMGLGPNLVSKSPASVSSDDSEMGSIHLSTPSSSKMDGHGMISPQVYEGHMNSETVKGVNFFGPKSEYVVSGSDCGRIFVWEKKCGKLIRVMEGDKHVVNCIVSHPHTMVLASSGIDKDIKIWTPKAIDRAILPIEIDKRQRPHPFYWFDDDDSHSYGYDMSSSDDYEDDDGGDDGEDTDEDDDSSDSDRDDEDSNEGNDGIPAHIDDNHEDDDDRVSGDNDEQRSVANDDSQYGSNVGDKTYSHDDVDDSNS